MGHMPNRSFRQCHYNRQPNQTDDGINIKKQEIPCANHTESIRTLQAFPDRRTSQDFRRVIDHAHEILIEQA